MTDFSDGRYDAHRKPGYSVLSARTGSRPLEPLQRRVERPLANAQNVLRLLLDLLAQRPAVHRLPGERAENQEVEGAAEKIGRGRRDIAGSRGVVLSASDTLVASAIVGINNTPARRRSVQEAERPQSVSPSTPR
jgi:hypothetical protein